MIPSSPSYRNYSERPQKVVIARSAWPAGRQEATCLHTEVA